MLICDVIRLNLCCFSCREELSQLRKKRRRYLNEDDQIQLELLPESHILLQAEIDEITNELGGDQFREMGDAASKLLSFPYLDI